MSGQQSFSIEGEERLLAIAMDLGAHRVRGWSVAEGDLLDGLSPAAKPQVKRFRERIRAGEDPLGEAFCQIRTAAERRKRGATYTPQGIVTAMIDWAEDQPSAIARIVDPGCGSGRFIVEAGRRFKRASLAAIELDPVAAVLARGHIAAAGLASRARVVAKDFREVALSRTKGRTLYIGNPPYVRHHDIDPLWKNWLVREAQARGLSVSRLAGLHIHFFLAVMAKAASGDIGTFITAAEWLDVNYGKVLRGLFLNGLGGSRIVIIEPTAIPFPDAATTAAITCFKVSSRPRSIRIQRVKKVSALGRLNKGILVRRDRMESSERWSILSRRGPKAAPGFVELGELCRVHRGQVTGSNRIWIAGPHSNGLPDSVLYPSVTRARELYRAGKALQESAGLRRVIDIPCNLEELAPDERASVDRFLSAAKALGADHGYIAQHRKAWWSVGLKPPAPILATYMARRPPAFVLNEAKARHINIAHGLYPREDFGKAFLLALVDYLSSGVSLADGRTYAGGLTKFEPKEMERLLVPCPERLLQGHA